MVAQPGENVDHDAAKDIRRDTHQTDLDRIVGAYFLHDLW